MAKVELRRSMNSMKKMFVLMSCISLTAILSLNALAQTPTATGTQESKKAKTKDVAAPQTDAEIQKCIEDKLAASTDLKGDGFTVAVSNGVATFTGTTKVKGHKGSVEKIAKKCGAKSTTNNIMVETAAKENTKTKKP
jgi:osmotically-inducible protein OsmY